MKQMKNYGQALVEFVMIVPILLFLLLIFIDFSNVFYHKNRLERILDEVVVHVKNADQDIDSLLNDHTTYRIQQKGDYVTITIEEKVPLITPFSNALLDNPYPIRTERTILYEK